MEKWQSEVAGQDYSNVLVQGLASHHIDSLVAEQCLLVSTIGAMCDKCTTHGSSLLKVNGDVLGGFP
ncbi:hypothetical protein U1Q18_033963 [Sarracenia purpurea var. burkii]